MADILADVPVPSDTRDNLRDCANRFEEKAKRLT